MFHLKKENGKMLTVLQAIQLSTEYLSNKGIESPRVNAELLLSNILNVKRLDLYLAFDKPLKENEIELYRESIKRRGKFEPLQYILGNVEFYGLKFSVDKNVLIPRPETELLVEEILNDNIGKENLQILDIGTGSGNIAISLAKNLNSAFVTAIDINEKALEVAKINAKLNLVDGKVNFSIFDIKNNNSVKLGKFDIIVSNPPYVSIEDYESLQNEIKIYEPKNAVSDYANGYSFYEVITEKSKILLNKNGKIYFELAKNQADKVKRLLIKNGLTEIEIKKDYQQIDRIIKGILS